MTYKGYTIAIVDTNGYSVTIEIRTKTIQMLGRKSSKLITRYIVDTRVNNPVDNAMQFIDDYTSKG